MSGKFFRKFDGGFMLKETHTSEPFKVFDEINTPDIHVYNNVSLPHNKKQTIRCSDPVFITHLIPQYIHFLVDSIGAYLYIKQFVPKLELKIFLRNSGGLTDAQREVLNIISAKNNVQIINEKDNTYIYDQVYDFPQESQYRKYPTCNSTNKLFPPVRDKFLSYAKGDETYEKIFISRAETAKSDRSIENEGDLDLFFKSIGYKVLYLERLTFSEQINYFVNAKYVAGIIGTGLTNTIFCNPGTKVISINTDCTYSWNGWARIADQFSLDYTELSFNYCTPTSAETLISRLKKLSESIF